MPVTPDPQPKPETVLGFDFGGARIGVAVAQLPHGIASPLQVLAARDGQPDWRQLGDLIREWQPARLVVGIPTRMDGSDSETTRAARRFARRLAHRSGLPVVEADERLSSCAAEQEWAQRRASGQARRRDANRLDALAARIILEQWMAAEMGGHQQQPEQQSIRGDE